MKDILQQIKDHNYCLTKDMFEGNEFEALLASGLFGIYFCVGGVHTSFRCAEISTTEKVPAMYLGGGLNRLNSLLESDPRAYRKMRTGIEKVPRAIVVFDKERICNHFPMITTGKDGIWNFEFIPDGRQAREKLHQQYLGKSISG